MAELLRFQKDFIKAVENPAYDTVAISGPRSLGKTFISAHVLIRCMTPGDVLHQPGKEYILAREVPERVGRPIVGVDLGGGLAWSAAVALYSNGRVEAKAVASGIPSLEAQEKRDRVPAGTYTRLRDAGKLTVAEGLKVQPPAHLWAMVKEAWGKPQLLVCDRFRLPELEDAVKHGARMEPRVSRWSEAAFDIRALRKMAYDGPLSVDVDSRALLATSLSKSMVKSDDQGNTRLVKKGTNNTSRDDVAAGLVLAAGAASVREAWRLALFGVLSPLGRLVESELQDKLEDTVTLSWQELRASDLSGRARAFQSMVGGGMEVERAAGLAGLTGVA